MYRNKTQNSEELSICGVSKTSHSNVLDLFRRVALRRVGHSFSKAGGALAIALFLTAGVFATGDTASYYLDIQKSLNNVFMADPLYFSVDPSQAVVDFGTASEPSLEITMKPGETSEPIQYQVHAVITGGDSAFCGSVHAYATAPFVYDGALASLSSLMSTSTGPWTLNMFVPSSGYVGTSCTMDIVYQGWNASGEAGHGYTDSKKVSLTFVAPPAPALSEDASSTPESAGPLGDSIGESSSTPDAQTSDASTTPSIDIGTPQTDSTSTAQMPAYEPFDASSTLPAQSVSSDDAAASPARSVASSSSTTQESPNTNTNASSTPQNE